MRIQGIVDNNVWPPMMGHTVRVWNLYKGLAQHTGVSHVRVIAALKSRERAVRTEMRDGVEIVRVKPWHPSVSAWLERAGLAPHFMAAEGYRRFPGTFVRAWDARADVLEVDSLLLTPLLEHGPRGALRVYGSQNVEIEWFERVGPKLAQRERWAAVMSREFEQHQRNASLGEETLLSHYGATSPAEFFAVCSEVFFELPQAMRYVHPSVYRELSAYYGLSPAE